MAVEPVDLVLTDSSHNSKQTQARECVLEQVRPTRTNKRWALTIPAIVVC